MPFPLLFAIGAGLSVGGKLIGGAAASRAGAQSGFEAIRAGAFARIKALSEARDIREEGEKFVAKQYTGFAKSGVVLDTGSPLLTMSESYRMIERDAIRTEQYGAEAARQKSAEANMLFRQARNAGAQAMLGAMGTMISAGSSISKMYKPGLQPTSKSAAAYFEKAGMGDW